MGNHRNTALRRAKFGKGAWRNSALSSNRRHFLLQVSLLFFFAFCATIASAQQVAVTLTTAGTLSEKIASGQKYTITSLKVSGPINGTDVRCLREMAGRDYSGNNTSGKLAELDLTDAKIVEGGDPYYAISSIRTENDVFGIRIFCYCNLKSIKLPNSVTSIGNGAFSNCSSLSSVTIPNSVTSIGSGVFESCSSLSSVTIPNSVTSIGTYAFYDCSSLSSVTIGNSVASIGSHAFSDCTALTTLVIHRTTPPTCGTEALDDINKRNCTLYVPTNSLAAYQAADQWKEFFFIEEGAPTGIRQPISGTECTVIRRYDASGRSTSSPVKGLNILKMSDGTTKKVLVK